MGEARSPRGDRLSPKPTSSGSANRILAAIGASILIGAVVASIPSAPNASADDPIATETPAPASPTFPPKLWPPSPTTTPVPEPSPEEPPLEPLPDPEDSSSADETGETPTPSPSPTPTWGPGKPNAYWVERARVIARKYWLGEIFVRQVMQESGFNEDVITGRRVSSAGAEGIAQIMRKYHPTVDPLNPEAALDYAAKHMHDLVFRYNGSVSKALGAYNAGVGRVDAAIRAKGDGWLSAMPEETQRYVAIIMRPGEPDILPKWDPLHEWWLQQTEILGQRLHLRLALGTMVAVSILPPPPEPAPQDG